ncbi:MAG: DUF359 domain-containing protein [Thermoprotei archaeon]|nr:MAG: DUF359 domain-containing protein [Thermoprotei archaeon]RLF00965.1 MAG: DUF359 domain-containing protein [Thermoprotei archaeon]
MSLKLTEELRVALRKPLGLLIRGHPSETIVCLKQKLSKWCVWLLITVGDFVTYNIITAGLEPKVCIIDRRTLREKDTRAELLLSSYKILKVRNPRSTITIDAYLAVRKALREVKSCEKYVILVEGEEDLLTLPAIVEAPLGAAVVYGQPREGLVVVYVTKEKKREIIENYLSKFENFENFISLLPNGLKGNLAPS